ncbi:MAG: MBOAT family O-acyltransferase [Vicingaceae bacterium]
MLFNSLDFAVFLPLVLLLYWFATQRNLAVQNALVVVSSYVFYGWWDYRFLSLIVFSTVVDFVVGLRLQKQENLKKRRTLLWFSVLVNLGFLGFFKYFNFFVDGFTDAFRFFGQEINSRSLDIVLPVGISFYTFQTLSYTIDVYRRKLEPTRDFIAFSAFVSFFPQLVAGPIERATNLLPQFYRKRRFDPIKATDGLRQILWGLFKKVVVADTCAEYVNLVYNHSVDYNGLTLFLATFFFAFQIYCDFSGYSDIAIGTARLFGFNLMQNFAFPYFSRDIAEFWRRWHISLSTWFRDYLYIPLGGSRTGRMKAVRNIFIIFIVSGFWHGANWTFIAWGALNALFFLPVLLRGKNRSNLDTVAEGRRWASLKDVTSMLGTFLLTLLAWIFFRADSMAHAVGILGKVLSPSLFEGLQLYANATIILIIVFTAIEWTGRHHQYAIEGLGLEQHRAVRWTFYSALCLAIVIYHGVQQEFIYFQF